jgi:hypothetical protein
MAKDLTKINLKRILESAHRIEKEEKVDKEDALNEALRRLEK